MELTAIDYASFGVTGAVVIFLLGITFMGPAKTMEDMARYCFLATGLYNIGWASVELWRWLGGWPHYVHLQGVYSLPLATHLVIWGIRKKGRKIFRGMHPLEFLIPAGCSVWVITLLGDFDFFYITVATVFGWWLALGVIRLMQIGRRP